MTKDSKKLEIKRIHKRIQEFRLHMASLSWLCPAQFMELLRTKLLDQSRLKILETARRPSSFSSNAASDILDGPRQYLVYSSKSSIFEECIIVFQVLKI